MSASARIAELRRARPRSLLLRGSLLALAAIAAYAWLAGDFNLGELFHGQRAANWQRFWAEDALPAPLRDGSEPGELRSWLSQQCAEKGVSGAGRSLGISVLAIVLAGAVALLLAPLGARTLMICDPYVPHTRHNAWCHAFWVSISGAMRLISVLLRAIPEYVWAFLFLAALGPSAWPAVLALAIHNSGILGRLGAETVENLPPGPLAALRSSGASRRQLAVAAVFPLALSRWLLLFFYRFETCVREATVLGMLGVVSIGYYVVEAKARFRYDEILFLIALSAILVAAADVTSQIARRFVRESGR